MVLGSLDGDDVGCWLEGSFEGVGDGGEVGFGEGSLIGEMLGSIETVGSTDGETGIIKLGSGLTGWSIGANVGAP